MRKFISILLILVVVFPTWISIPFLQYEKYLTKKTIKKKILSEIDRSELVLLGFHSDEVLTKLDWEHASEFEFNNEMYDVVEKKVVGDSVYFWCWWDYEETSLNRRLKRLVKESMAENPEIPEHSRRLSEYLHSLYFEDCQNYMDVASVAEGYHQNYNNTYNSLTFPPPIPPPQV